MYTLATPQKTDYPTLLEIWEMSVRATHHFLNEDDISFFKRFIIENQVFGQVEITLVQGRDGAILGFSGVAGDTLEMLFVAPQAQGLGLGRLLLLHAIDQLEVTQVDVNEQNERALKFYEHFGFKVRGRSELDGTGKPYPILHLTRGEKVE